MEKRIFLTSPEVPNHTLPARFFSPVRDVLTPTSPTLYLSSGFQASGNTSGGQAACDRRMKKKYPTPPATDRTDATAPHTQ